MLFFTIEDKGSYIYFKRKKFTYPAAIAIVAILAVLMPLAGVFVRGSAFVAFLVVLPFALIIAGVWIGVEGSITSTKIGRYRKAGKKIEYETGKEVGISGVKVYK